MRKIIAVLFALVCFAPAHAQKSLLLRDPLPVPAAAPSTTTWDSSNAAAKITVSNGAGLTATQTGASGGFNSVKSVASHSSGKFCFQVHADVVTSTWMIGMGNATESLTNFPGNDNNGFGATSDGKIWYNGANPTTTNPSFVTGNTVIECVDITNALVWIQVNGGNWNAGGSANPATGVGGIALTSVALASGPFFAMGMFAAQNDANTITTISSLPSGFGNW